MFTSRVGGGGGGRRRTNEMCAAHAAPSTRNWLSLSGPDRWVLVLILREGDLVLYEHDGGFCQPRLVSKSWGGPIPVLVKPSR